MTKINRIKELTEDLLRYCYLYYTLDKSEISDEKYDELFNELDSLEKETGFSLSNSPTHKVQGETLPFLTKVKHSVPMLSTDKSTNVIDVKKFIGNKDTVVSFKLDGGTVVCKYLDGKFVQALTRGSGEEGEDITHTAKMIKNLPLSIPCKDYVEVRGEALVPWKYYEEMNKDGSLGHPRNIATGGLRQLDAEEASKKNIYFYAFTLVNWKNRGIVTKWDSLKFLADNGFDVVPHLHISNDNFESVLSIMDRNLYDNPTDGWVFQYNDLIYGESLGSTGHHTRDMFALKPDRETVETTLIGVDWTLGKTGQITPTAVMRPVEINNTIVERASLHNLSIMKSLNLSINCRVKLYKANLIIPQIDSCCCQGDVPITIPSTCPVCGGMTQIIKDNDSEILMCVNPLCAGKLLGKMVSAVSKKALNIEGMNEATLQFLIDKGWLKDIPDIYKLSFYRKEWITCDGFGETRVDNILKSIEKSRNIDLAHFIVALNINGIGVSASKTLAKFCDGNYNKFIKFCKNNTDWTNLEDFGEVTSRNLDDYISNNINKIIAFANEMVFIVPSIEDKVLNNFISGKTFCVTGKFETMTRIQLEKIITDRNGKLSGSVSKKTDWLLTNESDSGSSKSIKAKELNIQIMNEKEFLEKIKEK